MTDRPIIFSGPMVRALLEGRKTQTRRLASSPLRRVETGDRLWTRENFHTEAWYDRLSAEHRRELSKGGQWPGAVWYPAGELIETGGLKRIARISGLDLDAQFSKGKQWPSIHMPRWASRLTLVVQDVRFQRLQETSETDAIAEGIEPGVHPDTGEICGWRDYETIYIGPHKGANHPHAIVPYSEPWRSYASLWDVLHREPGERWQDNPEIVALTFRVARANIDTLDKDQRQ